MIKKRSRLGAVFGGAAVSEGVVPAVVGSIAAPGLAEDVTTMAGVERHATFDATDLPGLALGIHGVFVQNGRQIERHLLRALEVL
jgi:hypothetical protein